MTIHKEGYPLIFIFFCLLLGLGILVDLLLPSGNFLSYVFYSLCLVALVFITAFFRSPHRENRELENTILCPADGKVVVIEKVFDNEFLHEERIQVSIFMSPFNVHVNWYPVKGMIKTYKYHQGRYLVAWHPKSSDSNERTTVIIEDEKQRKILVRQIAGAVARRIVCYAEPDKMVNQGSEMGFIKFGSRVDLLLPKDTQIQVNLNQKVIGKKTIIGLLPS
ncbi:MAG: phosphatidylserine decarboxylase family protein [Bacteroidales bacterium]